MATVLPQTAVATTPTVAALLLQYLELEGVTHIFGIPGGGLGNMLTELKNRRDTFTYVICRQETGAAYIADGYARITGGLGVVFVTSGPGATNALTGSMNAEASGTPLLTVTGEVAESTFGRGYLQEGVDAKLNVDEIYMSAVAYSAVISSPTNAATLIEAALRAARATPGQASHLSLPNDVSAASLPQPPRQPAGARSYRAVSASCDVGQAAQAFDALTTANRPLILLGNGARRALADAALLADFVKFVEKFAIPVITTPDAKAIFPESHPLSLRSFGCAYCEWPQYYMAPAGAAPFDALLVVGSGLGELATNAWDPMLAPSGTFAQVDIDPAAIGRGYPVSLGIVSDAGAFLRALAQMAQVAEPEPIGVEERRQLLEGIKAEHSPYLEPDKRASHAVPILPQAMIGCISDLLPTGAHVFIDAGNCVGWAVHYMTLDPPATIHPTLNMGPMGFGVGAVIGGKLAAPDRTCIGIVGDGAFMMHGAEVSTAARYGVGAIFIVLYDDDLSMVAQGQQHFFPDPDPDVWAELYQLGAPDLAAFARSLGAAAWNVHTRAELHTAFTQAIVDADTQKRPQVIVVHIDRSEVPPYYQQHAT